MPMYDRSEATTCTPIDRWETGVGWLAHPDEEGQRASHAIRDDEGDVWLFDPLDAPGIDDLVAEIAEETASTAGDDPVPGAIADAVAGVVVLSDYHARDADVFAERYDVAVHVPTALDRSATRIDAPVERFEGGIAGFDIDVVRPMYAWQEAIAYRKHDRTLYVPDSLSSAEKFAVGDERIGLPTPSRLFPPTERFAGMTPERVLFGHGEGVFEDAAAALNVSLEGARRRFPRALLANVPDELRAGIGAFL